MRVNGRTDGGLTDTAQRDADAVNPHRAVEYEHAKDIGRNKSDHASADMQTR